MKKTITTLADFSARLRDVELSLGLYGAVAARAREEGYDSDDLNVAAALSISEPTPALPRGRGDRVMVLVATCWNEPPFSGSGSPLDVLRARVATLPGVEDVGEASVDTQLRLIWSFPVILRLSQ